MTIAGGKGRGNQLNQLDCPEGIYVDDDHQCIYIAEYYGHRIVEWKYDAKIGRVVAGGNGEGDHLNQLSWPASLVVDEDYSTLCIGS